MIQWFRRLGARLNPSGVFGKQQGAAVEQSNEAPLSREDAFRRILRDCQAAKDVRQWIIRSPLEDLDLGLEGKTLFGVLLQEKHENFSSEHLVNFSLLALQRGARPHPSEMPLLVRKVSESGASTMWPFTLLLDTGADPNTVVDGRPWLDSAIDHYRPNLALALIERGASLCDEQGNLRHDLLRIAFTFESWSSDTEHRYYKTFRAVGGSDVDAGLKVSGDDPSLDEGFGGLVQQLLARGLEINYVDPAGRTAYANASPVWQEFLLNRGAKIQGRNNKGWDIAEVLLVEGKLDKLEKLLTQDRNALFNTNMDGSFAASAWWTLSAHRATEALELFKRAGVWSDILGAVDPNGRNFFTAGLARLVRNGLVETEQEKTLAILDVLFGRLETEVHSSVWVDPDQRGETVNFWLANFKDQSLMKKYVLPRREVMINAALAQVDEKLADEPYVRPAGPRF